MGTFKVPVGIDFKGVVASELTASADPGNHVTSAVLIDRSGTVFSVAPAATTDDKLKESIGHLS